MYLFDFYKKISINRNPSIPHSGPRKKNSDGLETTQNVKSNSQFLFELVTKEIGFCKIELKS